MIRLGVNIDHIATLRQLRAGLAPYPNLVECAKLAVKSGADQITVHLRGDRRHIQDKDVVDLIKARPAPLNLEMGATEEMVKIAKKIKPDIVCLVPEKREEITTEGGLDIAKNKLLLAEVVEDLGKSGIPVSMFIEPNLEQINVSAEIGARAVEFHTGRYALAKDKEITHQLEILKNGFKVASQKGLQVHAGHGLDYINILPLVQFPHLDEVNIGYSIICQAVLVGLPTAIQEMKRLLVKPG